MSHCAACLRQAETAKLLIGGHCVSRCCLCSLEYMTGRTRAVTTSTLTHPQALQRGWDAWQANAPLVLKGERHLRHRAHGLQQHVCGIGRMSMAATEQLYHNCHVNRAPKAVTLGYCGFAGQAGIANDHEDRSRQY